MREDTQFRFSLVRKLLGMAYGDRFPVPRGFAERAWPPTGDADRSMEGAFRAMALSAGGNRPEESRTTEERIMYDLDDGSFDVERDILTGDFRISRMLWSCPRCHGSGSYMVREISPPQLRRQPDFSAKIDMTFVNSSSPRTCDHKPAD